MIERILGNRTEQETLLESAPLTERRLPSSVDVVIVGANLSGRALAAALGSDVPYALIDSRKLTQHKEAMYLATNNTLRTWRMHEQDRNRRNHITSSVSFTSSGKSLIEFKSSGEIDSFAIIPQTAMESILQVDAAKVFYQTKCDEVENIETEGVVVHTDKGDIGAKLVVDATGWESNIIHQYYGDEDYNMAAVYGGNYRTEGFDPQTMYFIRGFPLNNKNWVMPISDKGAEVVAAQQLRRSQVDQWRENHSQEQFEQMVDWYKKRGYIIFNNKEGKRMGFRLEHAKGKYYKGRVIPFGEAAGLNSPYIGQLVDTLPFYAQKMAEIVKNGKQQNRWNNIGRDFYRYFITNSPYSYLIHSVIRDNSIKLQDGYPQINKKLTDALRETFSEAELWSIFNRNGIGTKELWKLVESYPLRLVEFALESVPSMALILIHNPELYAQFFAKRIKHFSRR